jgi:hypothetical protein
MRAPVRLDHACLKCGAAVMKSDLVHGPICIKRVRHPVLIQVEPGWTTAKKDSSQARRYMSLYVQYDGLRLLHQLLMACCPIPTAHVRCESLTHSEAAS